MTIQELITEARQKDETFNFKYSYWTETRKKKPDLHWLMPLLEEVLGTSYVRAAAQAQIDKEDS